MRWMEFNSDMASGFFSSWAEPSAWAVLCMKGQLPQQEELDVICLWENVFL